MTHVISPMWFYLCEVSDSAKLIAIIAVIALASVLGGLLVFGFGYVASNIQYGEEDCDYKLGIALIEIAEKFVIPFAITLVLAVVIPSKETLYKMMVADVATYENIDLTTQTIEEAFDHVIDKLVELGGTNNAEN